MFHSGHRQPRTLIWVLKQSGYDLRPRAFISRFDQMSVCAESFDMRGDATGDDGRAASHGLERRKAESFVQRRRNERGARRIKRAEIVIANVTDQAQPIAEVRFSHSAIEFSR